MPKRPGKPTKTEAPAGRKICRGPLHEAGVELDVDAFGRHARGDSHGRRATCKACVSAKERERYNARAELAPDNLPGLIPWSNSLEREAIEAVIAAGDLARGAESLGMTPRLLRGMLQEVSRRAARRGHAPEADMTKMVPDGYHVSGVSTMYDGDGNIRAQWVKSKSDQESRAEMLIAAAQRLAEPFEGLATRVDAPVYVDEDLLAVIPFGDPHFGMFAWSRETGDDFDLKIAERDLCTAVDHLISLAPPAKQALIIPLGDLVHADNQSNTTTKGTRVDVDSRQSKVIGVVIRAIAWCVTRALEKFETVKLVVVNGNHDDYTSLILAHTFAAYFRTDPRVEVDTSPDKFRWHRFGKVLIGTTHGDTCKREDLGEIMACDQPTAWAETTTRLWYTGHIHHETVKELRGCTVESFRTLAPKDAWHHASGYRSGQDLRLDVLHREHGRVNRHIIGIQQVRAKAGRGDGP